MDRPKVHPRIISASASIVNAPTISGVFPMDIPLTPRKNSALNPKSKVRRQVSSKSYPKSKDRGNTESEVISKSL